MINLFDLSAESLIKFTLLLRKEYLLMTVRDVRNLKLDVDDRKEIKATCAGKVPKCYSRSSFKFARKASELMEHIICEDEMLTMAGLSKDNLRKDVFIIAIKKRTGCEKVKKNCKWIEHCSKLVLMKKYETFSCDECPRKNSDEVSTNDVWLQGGCSNHGRLEQALYERFLLA